MKALLLTTLLIPVQMQPEAIIVSPQERMAIIERFEVMQSHIEKLERALQVCTRVQRS